MHACHSVPRRKWNKAETNSYERTIEIVVSTASSPTARVCLSQQLVLLLVSSRKRSKISDAALTENFSGSCRSSFLLVPNYPKQKLLTKIIFAQPYIPASFPREANTNFVSSHAWNARSLKCF